MATLAATLAAVLAACTATLTTALRNSRGKRSDDCRSIRAAQARAGIPSRTCAEGAVVTARNVAEGLRIAVERWVHEPHILPGGRIRQRNQSSLQRSRRS